MDQKRKLSQAQGRSPWKRGLQLRSPPASGGGRTKEEFEDFLFLEAVGAGFKAMRLFPHPLWVEACRRMEIVCRWLDSQLNQRPHVEILPGGGRRVIVFGCVVFSVIPEALRIELGDICGYKYTACKVPFSIGKPLNQSFWLAFVLDNIGAGRDNIGLLEPADSIRINDWIEKSVHVFLKRDQRFLRLQHDGLFAAMQLPPDIFAIARACRPRPIGSRMSSWTLNFVWERAVAFRRVARETPQLLPLVYAYWVEYPDCMNPESNDPVAHLRKVLEGYGFSPATWRYLVRHGARVFSKVWKLTAGQPALKAALHYLDMLQSCGLPPPPPPALAEALVRSYNPVAAKHFSIEAGFFRHLRVEVLRAGFIEADRRRGVSDAHAFAEEFIAVCNWSSSVNTPFDRNQVHAGWPWFLAQWRRERQEIDLIVQLGYKEWKARHPGFSDADFLVVPLRSTIDLVEESMAMRNCLRSLHDYCARRVIEMYSVRAVSTGKRIGCFGFKFSGDGVPHYFGVKGCANSAAPDKVLSLARQLFNWLYVENKTDRELHGVQTKLF